jgi:hypothetical protein
MFRLALLFRTFGAFRKSLPLGSLRRSVRTRRTIGSLGAIGTILSLLTVVAFTAFWRFRTLKPVTARLKLSQRAQKRFNFALIRELLTFSQLHQFQNFLHVFQRLPQGVHDPHHFIHSLTDG